MPNTYDVGEAVKVTATFKLHGVLADPTVVRAIIKDPDGTSTTISSNDENSKITKESLGVFSFEISLITPGFWYYRVDDGGNHIATEDYIQASLSNLV